MRPAMIVVPAPGFDHRQALDLLAARAGIEHESVGPEVIGPCRRQGPRA